MRSQRSRSKVKRLRTSKPHGDPASATVPSPTLRASLEDSEKVAGLLGDIESALTKLGETVKSEGKLLDTQATLLQNQGAQVGLLRQFFEKASREQAYALRFGRMWT